MKKVLCIVCEINKVPFEAELSFAEISAVLRDSVEFIPPATQRAWGFHCPLPDGCAIAAGGNALVHDNPPPPNRFGLVGNIVVTGPNGHSIPKNRIAKILSAIREYDEREMSRSFRIPGGAASAFAWERRGRNWSPEVHLTGDLRIGREIRFANYLLLRYAPQIVAYHMERPFGGAMYSLEFQFADSPEGREQARSFIKEYESGFSDARLKKTAEATADDYLNANWRA